MRKLITLLIGGATVFAGVGGPAFAATKPTPTPTPKVVTAKADLVPSKAPTPPLPKTHTVAAGDSLSVIAEAELLESWRPLWNVNPEVQDPNLIYEGQQLVVPTGPTSDRPLPEAVVPAPAQAAVTQHVVRKAVPANHAQGASGILERIRMREAGGNYATNTGNGYYGAYQFSLGTWRGVGGTGLPSDASPAEQDMRAQMLYDRRGCSPWPNTCY